MSAMFSFYYYMCFLLVLPLIHVNLIIKLIIMMHYCAWRVRDKHFSSSNKASLTKQMVLLRGSVRIESVADGPEIVCDNITGHVYGIHLRGNSPMCGDSFDSTRQLDGNLSSSLLRLKQLKHLDLSCNNFGGIQVPEFIVSLGNLRYLNLSASRFSEIIPPQLGNLSRLHVLSVGSFHVPYPYENTRMMNMEWLSSLSLLHHLDMSGVNLIKAIDWFQVINTLPSLTELHLSNCDLMDIHPHVPSLNITSLSLLDLSYNDFSNFVPQWVFSITNLVSLDFSWCNFHSPIHGDIGSFRNLSSLESLHVSGNVFMNSSLVIKGMSSMVAGNLVSLKIAGCGLSSSLLNSFYNLTSLRSLDLSENELTKKIPKSIVNTCNLIDINLAINDFGNISLNYLLEDFLECELLNGRSSPLEKLDVTGSDISGTIPYLIGRLSSLERLALSYNRLDGSLPDSLGYLSKLEWLTFSNNLLTGVVTESHFAKLLSLKLMIGGGNNLTLQPQQVNWIPPFRLQFLDLSSWSLGPQFPLWLHSQTQLISLNISNTGISSAMPVSSFWKSLPKLMNLDMSHNHIQGTLLDIPETVSALDLSSNEFTGELPELSNRSFIMILDLSSNFFVGSIHRLLCSKSNYFFKATLNLGNNRLSGVIYECWDKWQELIYLNVENNRLSGEIPETLGSLHHLELLNMRGNKLSGRIPASLMNLKDLRFLQLGRNELVGRIPNWLGNLSSLRLLNLRSNNFVGNIPYELCYPTQIQILDLAHNNISGNIPRCFNNFSVLSGKEVPFSNQIIFDSGFNNMVSGSDSLVMKGREDTYNSILGLVRLLDLSSNNLVGHIPSELMALRELKSLNLSRNRLTGRIPEKIGDMKSLETLDVSLNMLSGKLPLSLSSLTFLNSFNVSCNRLTGRVPSSTQLLSFNESSFFGNKLCGDSLTNRCLPTEAPNQEVQKEDDASHGADWGLITSVVVGLVVGFWLILAPLMVSRAWRIAYFRFLSELRYMVYDVVRKYGVNIFK